MSLYKTLVVPAVVDPDLELRREGRGVERRGTVLIYLPCCHFSLLPFRLFLPKIIWGRVPRAPPLDPPLAGIVI